tara:strand:+ start:497 stop:964 length:468 start_codon:yes stop_codon:yes gene_type:complete
MIYFYIWLGKQFFPILKSGLSSSYAAVVVNSDDIYNWFCIPYLAWDIVIKYLISWISNPYIPGFRIGCSTYLYAENIYRKKEYQYDFYDFYNFYETYTEQLDDEEYCLQIAEKKQIATEDWCIRKLRKKQSPKKRHKENKIKKTRKNKNIHYKSK